MLTFNSLWKNHPEIFGDAASCRTNGAKNFSDQCAINLGVALRRSGADLRISKRCWRGSKALSFSKTFGAEGMRRLAIAVVTTLTFGMGGG
ncbi:type VI secretion system amidase effector protein Tae4 [Pseudomonas sp. W2Aug9]|uniref:type VI secretion system amidase effector protein Tae4 n=1 Tax=Pseudomonas sp. W2Aug9 TaxID=1215242 RepID=UPI002005EA7F